MTYELAKQLKDAGLPQPKGKHAVDYDGYWYNNARKIAVGVTWEQLQEDGFEPIYEPTLSELIKQCGDQFHELHHCSIGHYGAPREWRAYAHEALPRKVYSGQAPKKQ